MEPKLGEAQKKMPQRKKLKLYQWNSTRNLDEMSSIQPQAKNDIVELYIYDN